MKYVSFIVKLLTIKQSLSSSRGIGRVTASCSMTVTELAGIDIVEDEIIASPNLTNPYSQSRHKLLLGLDLELLTWFVARASYRKLTNLGWRSELNIHLVLGQWNHILIDLMMKCFQTDQPLCDSSSRVPIHVSIVRVSSTIFTVFIAIIQQWRSGCC